MPFCCTNTENLQHNLYIGSNYETIQQRTHEKNFSPENKVKNNYSKRVIMQQEINPRIMTNQSHNECNFKTPRIIIHPTMSTILISPNFKLYNK